MIILISTLTAGCGQLPRIVELHDPLSATEHFQLAMVYEQKRQYDLALNEYQEVIKKGVFLSESYTNMGNIYSSQGKGNLSETYYLKSIQADPHYGKAYNNLAWFYMMQNRKLSQAEHLLQTAIEKDPENSASYLDTLGSVYEREGRWDQSLEVLKKAERSGYRGDLTLETEFLGHLEKVLIALDQKSEADRIHERIITLKAEHSQEIPAHVP